MFCMVKRKKDPACDSKYNSNYENKFILLKISNREKQWHCLAVRKLPAILPVIFIGWILFSFLG